VKLFHISEEPDIKIFNPRPVKAGLEGNAVWAIDEEHLPNYLLPRDCPRVTYFIDEKTNGYDIKKFFSETYAKRIIAVETKWLKQIVDQPLYKYEFRADNFELADKTAGYYISRKSVKPENTSKIENPLYAMFESNIELRVMPLLWKLREEVINSTLGFSIIRMNEAQKPPEGLENYYPLPE
jgi:hypothetical protein